MGILSLLILVPHLEPIPKNPLQLVRKKAFFTRSAPKGRQQKGETGFCKNLRFSAVSCENLRFPAVFCANLRLPNPLIYRASRKSAKICKNLRKCAFRVRFLPFAVSLLARADSLISEDLGFFPHKLVRKGLFPLWLGRISVLIEEENLNFF